MLSTEGYFDGNSIKTFGNINAKKNQKVIVTFLDEFLSEPITDKVENEHGKRTARGYLKDFARTDLPNLAELEKEAWRKAAEKKYADT